jgi:hypothetical protein
VICIDSILGAKLGILPQSAKQSTGVNSPTKACLTIFNISHFKIQTIDSSERGWPEAFL